MKRKMRFIGFILLITLSLTGCTQSDLLKAKDKSIHYLIQRQEASESGKRGVPGFIISYEIGEHKNVSESGFDHRAYAYDNALAALAFISENKKEESKKILDGFINSMKNDGGEGKRIHNAYDDRDPRAFEVVTDPKHLETYPETETTIGTTTGNEAFVAIAMLQYYHRYGGETYLQTGKTLMDWVLSECEPKSGDGFLGGYYGSLETANLTELTYKSIENNVDAYSAFTMLYKITGEKKYEIGATSAENFIKSMYNKADHYFYVGTLEDQTTINTKNCVLDAQAWTALALEKNFKPYDKALDYTMDYFKQPDGGYAFDKNNVNGGTWVEGTAFTGLAFIFQNRKKEGESALEVVKSLQLSSGGFPAATVENLSTGFENNPEEGSYSKMPHIAPGAWFVLGVNQFNPFILGGK
ncbi:MAG: hypothetical protein ACRCU3_02200 [Eubacteriaceae bacterium]